MDIHLLLVIGIVLFSTKIVSLITRSFHLPQVIGALAAGLILGPAVTGFVQPSEALQTLADIGVMLLLFSAGMETDFTKLRATIGTSTLIAFGGIILAVLGGFGVAVAFDGLSLAAFFVGVIMACTSTSITIEALNELKQLRSRSGSILLGTSVMDDIMGIILLAVVIGMSAGGVSVQNIATTLVRIALFFVFALICGYGVSRLFNWIYAKYGERRRLSVFALAFCFVMAFIAEQFGLASITGAFIAGIVFCNTRCVERLEANTNTLSYMFFTPLFLANIGLMADFSGIDGRVLLVSGLLVAVALVSKVVGCGLAARVCGVNHRDSLRVGVGMMTRGDINLIVASKGITRGIIEPGIFSTVILIVLLTVLITPILLGVAYKSAPEDAEADAAAG